MKTLPFQGTQILLDDEDFERFKDLKFVRIHHYGRAYAYSPQHKQYLHRMILEAPGKETDHIDGNSFNNQRANLRLATHQQNMWNQRKRKTPTSSQYKGVNYVKRDRTWRAQFKLNGKQYFIGYFLTEHQAALAYDLWALLTYGEFARTNFTPAV